jgi:small-conductance mechanosensitive channel
MHRRAGQGMDEGSHPQGPTMSQISHDNTGGRKPSGRLLNPVRLAGWGLIAALLLTPAVAMRFTHEVEWTPLDFLYAGVLLIGAGLAFELVFWRVRGLQARLAIGLGILAVVLFFWAQGAVGIF